MSSSAPGPRPRQVTIGGSVVAVASTVLVITVFDTMTNLRSIDTRNALTEALTTGSLKDLGISVDNALTLIRGALFVAGAAAAMTAVLGIFVLQRHTSARIALTVAAVPVVLTAPFSGGLLGLLIGGATALLWTGPARDWYAGRPTRQPEPVRREASWPPPAAPESLPPPAPLPPRPMQAWPPPAPIAAPIAAPATTSVPAPVRVACTLTWIFSLLTAGLYVVLVVVIAVDRGAVLDRLRDNASIRDTSLSDTELVGALVAVSSLLVLWCLAAALLAALTWRRHGWAWLLLLVSVGVASFAELLALPYSLMNLAACITAFVLLLRPAARAWVLRTGSAGTPPPPQVQAWPPPSQKQPPGKPPVW